MSPTIHAILEWNPKKLFNPLAPEGIKLWTDVLEKFPPGTSESYTWWGKISMGRYVGMQPAEEWARTINDQIGDQTSRMAGEETHLYMYCSDFPDKRPPTLHVGRVIEVVPYQNAVSLGDPHVPSEFYKSKKDENERTQEKFARGRLISFWFKLRDIRQIPITLLDNLWVCNLEGQSEYRFDPVMREPYPCGVIEEHPSVFFDSEELRNEGRDAWWQECHDNVIVPAFELNRNGLVSVESQAIVLRKAEPMSLCVAPLLRRAREILLVDPHFGPEKKRFRNTLRAFLEVAVKNRRTPLRRVEYHLREHGSLQWFDDNCQRFLPSFIPNGLVVKFMLWEEKESMGERFHNRYLLTDTIGIRFPGGLDEDDAAETRETEDLSLVATETHLDQWNRFQEGANVYESRGTVSVTGRRR